MSLHVRTDRQLLPAGRPDDRFVLVQIDAPTAAPRAAREPVNLAFVLDRSGSMDGEKIDLARRAIEAALLRLEPSDSFSIVAYDDRIDLVVESTGAGAEARRLAMSRLREIDARGSTNLAGGWLRGAEQVALHLRERGVNRVLLLTDGLANVGITDPSELTRHAAELRARGVATSTFGVGNDFDESLLQSLADAGGGHFYYIAAAAQIGDYMSSEVGEALAVTAHGAYVDVTLPETVGVEVLSQLSSERHGSRVRIELGDLISGQQAEAVVRLRFPGRPTHEEVGALVAAGDRDATFGLQPVAVGWRYTDAGSNAAQPRDREVERAAALLLAARARQEAVRLNRQGEFAAAATVMSLVEREVAEHAPGDAVLGELLASLHEEGQVWSAPAPEMMRKQAFASAAYLMRGRDASGRARREER